MRRTFICGNWKMNGKRADAGRISSELLLRWQPEYNAIDVAVAPPFTSLDIVRSTLEGSPILLAAQNCSLAVRGAYTGEIAAEMLLDAGCQYIILGHSERRTMFGETNEIVAEKLSRALEAGLSPIVCIGETELERANGRTEVVLESQLRGSLSGTTRDTLRKITIAYEPVWAIGTGKTATTDQAQRAHEFIRECLMSEYGEVSNEIRIQYGGSMKPENAFELLSMPDIDGGLIGGASLDAASFAAILSVAAQVSD